MQLVATLCHSLGDVAFCVLPAFRYFNLVNAVNACVYCSAVHVYDVLSLAAVSLLDGFLHVSYSLIDRQDVCQLEECSLKN